MSRPEDISEEVWETARVVYYSVLDAEPVTGHSLEIMARAILAERDRCAKVAREYVFTDMFFLHTNHAVAGNAAQNIAAMIEGRLEARKHANDDFRSVQHLGPVS